MKRIIFITTIISCFFIASCNKVDINNTADKVGISRVTNFATFKMNGNQYMAVVQGSSFTDPGTKAFEAGTEIPVTVSGTVNTGQVGLYVITYSATNKDGYSSSITRNVVVLPSHENPGVDLSGKYDYVGSSTYTATVTKVAEGTYTTDNAWSGLTVIPLVFISVDGLNVTVPLQTTGFGRANGTGTYNPSTKRLVYKLNLLDQGISNSTRTWQKQ